MAADEPPTSGRINLADPGSRPSRTRARRLFRLSLALLLLGGIGAGLFLVRGPIWRGSRTAAAAVWDVCAEWSSELRDQASEVPDPIPTTTLPPPEPVESKAALVVVGSGAGDSGFALLVRPPLGDPEMVMIPQSLLVQVPGYGEFSMAEALGFGGPRLASLALSNEMGVRIDDTAPVGPGGLAVLGGEMVVDVPVELYVENEDGSRRLIAPGPQRLSIELVELLMVEQGTGSVFEWLQRQEAVWESILAVIADQSGIAVGLAADSADPSATAGLLVAVAEQASIGAPPLDRVAIGASQDAFVLATDRIGIYLIERLGHLMLSAERRPRVEVLNGNGTAGSGIPVAEILVREGFYVFRSGNADRFDYAESQVIAQGDDAAEAARTAAAALGVVTVLLEGRAPSGVVDVSIIVGTDLAPKEG